MLNDFIKELIKRGGVCLSNSLILRSTGRKTIELVFCATNHTVSDCIILLGQFFSLFLLTTKLCILLESLHH